MEDETHRAIFAHNVCGHYSRADLEDFQRGLSPHTYSRLHWAIWRKRWPWSRGAEAVIWGVQNFNEVREMVLSMARGRPLFAEAAPDISQEILTELRRIGEALEKGIN